MSAVVDYIVVGSGCTGAIAAQTLVEADKQVLMIDAGVRGNTNTKFPNKNFLEIRRSEPEQYKYFVGEEAEGLLWGGVGKAEQITPLRKHISQMVDELLPIDSQTFDPVESLGYGGLGIGWGLGSWEYSRPELDAIGLDHASMQTAYQTVGDRIGISGERDDAAAYTLGGLKNYQPAPKTDRNHELIQKLYAKHKNSLQKQGFVLGRAPLALITKDMPGRKAYKYGGLDYYSDQDKSAYRPWITVDELQKSSNFTYRDGLLVTRFKEEKNRTTVYCLDISSGKQVTMQCKRLVLSPGILGTARIVLRSLGTPDVRLPLLCNPYSYIPCLQPRFVGKADEENKLGFAQLSLFLDEDGDNFDVAMASIYGYQSLMLFRLIKQAPFGFRDSAILFRYLVSGLVIAGLHQPDSQSDSKYLQLAAAKNSPTGDKLLASYTATPDEIKQRKVREKAYVKALRKMGTYAVKRIDPGFGASIHYAGCLPYDNSDKPFTLDNDGRLHGTRSVYVADGSGFRYLPAKGLTFTLMANAHRTALGLLERQ